MVAVFLYRVFKGSVSENEVLRVRPTHIGLVSLLGEGIRTQTRTEGHSREDPGTGQPPASLGEGPREEPALPMTAWPGGLRHPSLRGRRPLISAV